MSEPRRTVWATSCSAVCSETGKRCALPSPHPPPHASGRHRFVVVAEPGQTRFRERDRIDFAAQSNAEGEGSWVIDEVAPPTSAITALVRTAPLPVVQPVSTQETSMSKTEAEEKSCSKCGKRLRADNTRGVCGQAGPCAARAAATNGSPAVAEARVKDENPPFGLRTAGLPPGVPPIAQRPRRQPTEADETLRRFRLLAEALGFDADEVLAGFAKDWLERARSAVTPATLAPVADEASSPAATHDDEDAAA